MKKTPIILTLTTLLLCAGGSAAIATPLPDAEYRTAFVKPLVRCASKPACRKIAIDKLTDLKTELVVNFVDYIWDWSAEPNNAQSDTELKEKLQELERTLRESGRHNPEVQHKLDGLYDLLSNKPRHLS